MKKIKDSIYNRVYDYEGGNKGHSVVVVDTGDKSDVFDVLRNRLHGLTIVDVFESYDGVPCFYVTDGDDVYIVETFKFKGRKGHSTEMRVLVDDNN